MQDADGNKFTCETLTHIVGCGGSCLGCCEEPSAWMGCKPCTCTTNIGGPDGSYSGCKLGVSGEAFGSASDPIHCYDPMTTGCTDAESGCVDFVHYQGRGSCCAPPGDPTSMVPCPSLVKLGQGWCSAQTKDAFGEWDEYKGQNDDCQTNDCQTECEAKCLSEPTCVAYWRYTTGSANDTPRPYRHNRCTMYSTSQLFTGNGFPGFGSTAINGAPPLPACGNGGIGLDCQTNCGCYDRDGKGHAPDASSFTLAELNDDVECYVLKA